MTTDPLIPCPSVQGRGKAGRPATIATAGHVDHGKSALVLALTGTDPDRLREEKERGLTIELGFARLALPGGADVSIIDVPGHERFIKTMLAGVGGIDLALLVIAADEGVMPQTREHLAILDLLGVEHGVVALTKADAVDETTLTLAHEEALGLIAGTALDGSPVVPCSARTGDGLPQLVAAIEARLGDVPPRRDAGRPRLPVDRAFTMAGFGTVVTGTLIDGPLRTGDEVALLPGELRARVRGLQHHGEQVELALPGRRTAVNLAGVSVEQLSRGMVLTHPGAIAPTRSLDVRLRAVPYLSRPVKHNARVTVHLHAAEAPARLVLLDRDVLPPGESGWAQLRLDAPLVALPGDRFVIRDPNDTLGGGEIIETDVPRHRRFHASTLDALARRAAGDPHDAALAVIARLEPVSLPDVLAALGGDSARPAVDALLATGQVIPLGGASPGDALIVTADGFSRLAQRTTEALATYHAAHPLREGMRREELRSRLGLPPRAFDALVRELTSRDAVREPDGEVALASHRPVPDEATRAAADAYVARLEAGRFSPPTGDPIDRDLLAYLERAGRVVRVSDAVVFEAAAYEDMVSRITQHLRAHGTITLAQVRDMFATTRKYAQPLLEHLDARHITRRQGDERILTQN